MSFIDKVRVHCRAGAGGDGCLSFRREKFVEFGGPNGGDGGKGGDVLLVADRNKSTLLDFAYHPHLIAGDGSNGKGSNKTGAGAPDFIVYVPVGTVVYKDGVLLADLLQHGDRFVAARGGRGGRGNLAFKTHKNTAPRIAERGEPGENLELDLELKLIADVGLVGLPNAGKSSLLARVSNARPKVADYPFTTLSPHLGIVAHKQAGFVMADIPGLIDGAHAGKGLGDEFLRHVERTHLLIHMVDPLGYGDASPLDGIRVIEAELRAFSPALAAKPKVLVVNKLDLPQGPVLLKRLKARYRRRHVFGISAATGQGVGPFLDFLVHTLVRLPHRAPPAVRSPVAVRDMVRVRPGFRVVRENHRIYRVTGDGVERLAAMTNMSQPQAVERFQRSMKKIGVDRSLRKAGVLSGDTVRIGPVEFEWMDNGG